MKKQKWIVKIYTQLEFRSREEALSQCEQVMEHALSEYEVIEVADRGLDKVLNVQTAEKAGSQIKLEHWEYAPGWRKKA